VGSLFEFARKAHKDDIIIDMHIKAYLMVTGKHVIVPTKTLVENIGLDGTGCTMPINDEEMQDLCDANPMSTDIHFEYIGTGYEEYEFNNDLYLREREWRGKWFYQKRMLRKIIKYLL
jgi:hypothetical protein